MPSNYLQLIKCILMEWLLCAIRLSWMERGKKKKKRKERKKERKKKNTTISVCKNFDMECITHCI